MAILHTRLNKLNQGTMFRTSTDGSFYSLDGYNRLTRRMNITAANGDYCQMKPKRKVIIQHYEY
ncbi:hypothetical protein N9L46_03650 [Amylibacter sp.]|nr:hypothetical protein [Amylibacter sp.]